MIKKKYSKSSSFYLGVKKDFFDSNQKMLSKANKQNKFYKTQIKEKSVKFVFQI